MSSHKKEHKKTNKIMKRVFVIILIILVAILVVLVVKKKLEKDKIDTNKTETGVEKDIFPCELGNGKLKVISMFQYSGFNPDCEDEEMEDIAALEILNQSEEFCESVKLEVTMQDGEKISFQATDIPAGKKIWVFAIDNQSIEQDEIAKEVNGDADFGKSSVMEKQITYSVEDTTILLQNNTEEDITDISVYCHCLFEDIYFGGITYCYPVKSIATGESITVEADDCYMGTAEVVCIKKDN